MDKSVPKGAALLLAFIYETETSRKPPECYDVIYGHNQRKLKKPLTRMTYGEIVDAQKSWSKNYGSSACGAGQFMRATLQGLANEIKSISGADLFDPDLQDRLGYHLLRRRGYDQFVSGQIGAVEFGKRLAQEWASFPVLAGTKGAKRTVARGQSYYAGDGLNKSLVNPEKVEAVLHSVLAVAREPSLPDTPAVIKPAPVKDGNWIARLLEALANIIAKWRAK